MLAFIIVSQIRLLLFFVPAENVHRTDIIAKPFAVTLLIVNIDWHFTYYWPPFFGYSLYSI